MTDLVYFEDSDPGFEDMSPSLQCVSNILVSISFVQ
jgi:hypothetical protein